MRLVAKVRVEHSDPGSTLIIPQSGKDVEVALVRGERTGAAVELQIRLKGKPLTLPVVPPVALYGARVVEGQLGLKFLRVKMNPWDSASKCVQVHITCPDTDALTLFRDRINQTLMRCAGAGTGSTASGASAAAGKGKCASGAGGGAPSGIRRPLAPRSLNTLSCRPTPASSASCGFGGGGAFSVRSGAGAPTASGVSFGASSRQLASSAESRPRGGEEDLASLSEEQQRALDLVRSGKSIFFTGCAGTGKSLLLRHMLGVLPRDSTFVTGTTGLAACHLGGTTINSYAGIGRGEGDLESLVRAAARGESLQRWRRTQALIIDEVSMMDGRLFDTLEAIARRVRGSNAPFGGVQLILSGDFHQLPPVAKGREGAAARKFCFEAEAWGRCIHDCCLLSKVYRQTDLEFVELLAKVRGGACPAASLRGLLDACARPLPTDDGILPTKLYTHREDVDAVNGQELAALSTQAVRFSSQDVGSPEVLAAACPAKRQLELKVGAQVMLIKNVSHRQGLVNGARGVVERFSKSQQLPVVRFANGEVVTVGRERWTISSGGRVVAQRVQVPLDLAWALSVHKCQGMTLDRVEVSLERAFEPGMAYVALSRVKAMEGLRILGSISAQALRADVKVVAFYKALRAKQLAALGLDSTKFTTIY